MSVDCMKPSRTLFRLSAGPGWALHCDGSPFGDELEFDVTFPGAPRFGQEIRMSEGGLIRECAIEMSSWRDEEV